MMRRGFRTVRPVAPPRAVAPVLRAVFRRGSLVRHDIASGAVDAGRRPIETERREPSTAYPSLFGFRTVGEIKVQPGVSVSGVPVLRQRKLLDQTTMARLAQKRLPPQAMRMVLTPTPYGASTVGIVASGGTTITMVPANLTMAGVANITDFVTVSLDAGVY